ncbi:MAG: hypothetical protein OXC05_13235, partial [Halieaceae bacterium]|nr:hypothetical protein [Halieaceae bacterium]
GLPPPYSSSPVCSKCTPHINQKGGIVKLQKGDISKLPKGDITVLPLHAGAKVLPQCKGGVNFALTHFQIGGFTTFSLRR